jgi:hypothetical protein
LASHSVSAAVLVVGLALFVDRTGETVDLLQLAETRMRGIRGNQVAMISDSCYSGAFTKEQKVGLSGNIKPEEILVKRSVVVMSSGGDEPVADGGKGGHSIFAWHLMQTLASVDRWQAGTNVFEEVQHKVHNRRFPQTPQYGAAVSAGHQAGDDGNRDLVGLAGGV